MRKTVTLMMLLACSLLFALPSHAQRTETRLYKKWIAQDEDGSKVLFDMSDKKTWIMAVTYTAETCKEMGEPYKPGVFYEIDRYEVRIVPGGFSYGEIEYKSDDGKWENRCSYEDLKSESVSFVFEGEFVWHATVTQEDIKVVKVDTKNAKEVLAH